MSLNNPLVIAVTSTDAYVITDGSNFRIRLVNASGTMTTIAGDGDIPYKGDGGQATSSSISLLCVVVTSMGDYIIADGAAPAVAPSLGAAWELREGC